MKKTTLALAAVLGLGSLQAYAADAPKPDWAFTGNAGLFSDYRFRGISQTNKKPAFQGGFDVSHVSGFYAGNWNSNIDSAFFNGANLEMDFYGGYKLPLGDLTLDFGALHYYYPGSGAGGSFKIDNTELYVGGSYGPVSLKYFHAVSDFFGAVDSKNSQYLDAGFAYDLGGGLGVNAHVGYQKLKGGARVVEIGSASLEDTIIDWKLGATYDILGSGFVAGAAYVSTNRDLTGGTAALSGRNISNGTLVLSLSKTF
ncbi:MAG TPA: TorF family putative porin [Methylibium sp.]|uniref:TorF family putative porin n=1 Tax=Methylibium sp. TaxID=2067992 RepID=UPI002DC040A9|nr:TorF family putative porin [Methylibium sp.]HEU4460143.1 TorF family putative porin [Methylibium sp.]